MSCFISFSICAFFYACLIQNADAYVMGIDMGSEFIKIAAIRPRIGVDVVLNEQSRRKTFQFVGFRGEDRYIGEDAKNLAPRFPQNMISMLNRLIGIAYDDVQTRDWYTQELMHTYELLENERRKTIDIHIRKNPNQTFDIETLMGIIFSYIRQITKEHNDGIEITDAVLIIPSFFTSRQRTALLDAAQLGGIKVLGMMHTTTAIALQYGIQNRGFTNPVDIIIYDMGTSSTEVGLYTITPPPKGAKKSDSLGTITTRHIVSDPFLGGRNFDACLARKVASGIQNVDILSNLSSETGEKHAVILMRAANKAREVLSANKFTPVTFEGVLPNQMDYTTKVTREEFESWCGSYFERAMGLARRALEAMTTPPESLHAFEIHGGAVRMPKFQEDMHALLSRPVNRTLNGDESAALGAAYYAARLSGSFVVRGFAIHEVHPQNITFSLSPKVNLVESKSSHEDGEVHEEVVTRALFVNATLPRRRSITVTRTENFNVTLFSNDEWDRELHVTDLHATLSDMGFHSSEKDANNTHSVRLEMRLNESGLIEMNQAIAKYNEWVNVTKKVKVPVESKEKEDKIDGLNSNAEATEISSNEPEIPVEKEEDKSPEPSSESDSSTTNNESDSSNENSTNNEASNQDENHTSSSDDASKQASIENKIEPKFEYRTVSEKKQKHHQKNLQVDIVYRNPQPMNKTEYQSALKMLKIMSDREKLKHETAAAKNDLETLIIGVLTDYLDQFEKYITVEETERIQSVARVAREWLEDGDGMSEHTTKEQFLEQLGRIHAELKPVVDKKKEHLDSIEKARKEAIQKAIEIERAKRAAEKEAERRRKEESQNQTNPPEASDSPDQSDKPDHEDHVQADAETKDSAGESPEEL